MPDGLAFMPPGSGVIDRASTWVAGRIIGPNIDKIARIVPFAAVKALMGKGKDTDTKTKQQAKEDGKMLIKVSDAIKVVQDELDGFVGDYEKFMDLVSDVLGSPSGGDERGARGLNLSSKIAESLRENALRQDTPRKQQTKTGYFRR